MLLSSLAKYPTNFIKRHSDYIPTACEKLKQKYTYHPSLRLVLAEDGTSVDDDTVGECCKQNKVMVLLRHDETWTSDGISTAPIDDSNDEEDIKPDLASLRTQASVTEPGTSWGTGHQAQQRNQHRRKTATAAAATPPASRGRRKTQNPLTDEQRKELRRQRDREYYHRRKLKKELARSHGTVIRFGRGHTGNVENLTGSVNTGNGGNVAPRPPAATRVNRQ